MLSDFHLFLIQFFLQTARDLRKILNKDARYGGVGWKGMASVDTAHRFQGSEVDCVILDLTDGPGGEVLHHGFLGARQPNETGARLTNVAISRARCLAMSKKASNSGVFFPRQSAPISALGKSASGSARTFFSNGFPGTLTDSPIPSPLAT